VLIVRDSQLSRFTVECEARQVAQLVKHLQASVAQFTADKSTPELYKMVEDAIEEANRFGIEDSLDLRRYVRLAVELGYMQVGLSAFTWAHEFLADPGILGYDKVNRLESEAVLLQLIEDR
jgi:hypothetical protein